MIKIYKADGGTYTNVSCHSGNATRSRGQSKTSDAITIDKGRSCNCKAGFKPH